MTDIHTPGADQAAANAHAVTDRLLIHGDNKIEAAALILALRQENAELRRALEDERAARRASVNVAVKTKLGSGRKP